MSAAECQKLQVINGASGQQESRFLVVAGGLDLRQGFGRLVNLVVFVKGMARRRRAKVVHKEGRLEEALLRGLVRLQIAADLGGTQ